MNEVLAEILATRIVKTETGEQRPLHSQIGTEEGEFIQRLIREYRPRVSLEVGCAYGISSLYALEALQEVGADKHIIIDPYELPGSGQKWPDSKWKNDWEGIGLSNIKAAGYERLVEFYGQPPYRQLPKLEEAGQKIDFAIIDGLHTFDGVFVDFFYVDKMLNVGGVVVFDDVDNPGIRKVVRYIVTNLPYKSLWPKGNASMKRKIAGKIASLIAGKRHIIAPEFLQSDPSLGLSDKKYIAVRKERHVLFGDADLVDNPRLWNAHAPF
jgi:predicted O-methyltransferase YrrM